MRRRWPYKEKEEYDDITISIGIASNIYSLYHISFTSNDEIYHVVSRYVRTVSIRDVLIDANICIAVADVCVLIGAVGYWCTSWCNVLFNGDFYGSFVSGRMTDVEANSCTIRGYCSRFKMALAFALAAATVSDGELSTVPILNSTSFHPCQLAFHRQFYWLLSLGSQSTAMRYSNICPIFPQSSDVGLSDSFLTFDWTVNCSLSRNANIPVMIVINVGI